jgi:hypothetical protein
MTKSEREHLRGERACRDPLLTPAWDALGLIHACRLPSDASALSCVRCHRDVTTDPAQSTQSKRSARPNSAHAVQTSYVISCRRPIWPSAPLDRSSLTTGPSAVLRTAKIPREKVVSSTYDIRMRNSAPAQAAPARPSGTKARPPRSEHPADTPCGRQFAPTVIAGEGVRGAPDPRRADLLHIELQIGALAR